MSIASRVVSVVILAGIAAGGYALYQQQQVQKQAADAGRKGASKGGGGQPPVPVVIAPVETRSVPVKLNLVGRAEAFSSVTLRARADGQVVQTYYTPGMHVRRGQVMVRLDSRAIQAQVQQGEANLARDRAQLDKAKSDLARYTDLLAKGFISPAQLETYRATVDTLDATVKADIASLELLRVQLTYTTIEAPMDGVAGAVLVFPGGGVKANDTPLVVINQLRPLYVTFAVPETQLREVNRDRLAERLRVDARIPGPGSEPVSGQLVFVDNAVDSTTGTIQMKARFDNANERLTPGQFVEVSMTLRNIDDALVIPNEALQTGPEGTYVYVAKTDQTVEVRKVQTRPADSQRLIVLQGLGAGEKVVTDGQVRLTPGSRWASRETPKGGPGGEKGSAAAKGPGGDPARGDPAKSDGAAPGKPAETSVGKTEAPPAKGSEATREYGKGKGKA